MINQLGVTPPPESSRERLTLNIQGLSSGSAEPGLTSSCSTPSGNGGGSNREVSMELDASSFASSFLASLNNPRPRRFSASFSPVSLEFWMNTWIEYLPSPPLHWDLLCSDQGSPGPAPNRVSQLRRQENTPDWETVSEKEFHGTINMAQSWEDLSLVRPLYVIASTSTVTVVIHRITRLIRTPPH
jgi:hypothetical protein